MMKNFSVPVVTVATAGTRVQVTNASGQRFGQAIMFQADPDNTGVIYVGDSSVDSTNGLALQAGQSISFNGAMRRDAAEEYDLQDFYVDSDTNTQKVRVSVQGRRP